MRRYYYRGAGTGGMAGCLGRLLGLTAFMGMVYIAIPICLIGTCVCLGTIGRLSHPETDSPSAPKSIAPESVDPRLLKLKEIPPNNIGSLVLDSAHEDRFSNRWDRHAIGDYHWDGSVQPIAALRCDARIYLDAPAPIECAHGERLVALGKERGCYVKQVSHGSNAAGPSVRWQSCVLQFDLDGLGEHSSAEAIAAARDGAALVFRFRP